MNENQNKFYTSISNHYSEIFPFNPAQQNFVETRLGNLAGKTILDIGCATGELAFRLAGAGAHVTAIDLNEDLLQQARLKKNHPNLLIQQGNMLDVSRDFKAAGFDGVLCFGNTLVHLNNTGSVLKMFEGVRSVLKPGGQFLLQILNYDYIIDNELKKLPLIETDSIVFNRKYEFSRDGIHVDFITELKIKETKESISNSTSLLALRSAELFALLKEAGFIQIEFFSSFRQNPFGGNHLPLVAACVVPFN